MRIHLTRAATISQFTRFLEEGGSSVTKHLTTVGISPELLTNQELLLPLEQGCAFLDLAAQKDGIENLGLDVGNTVSIISLGLFGQVIEQALTLKDVIEKLIQWVPLTNSGARVWLEAKGPADDLKLCIAHDVRTAKRQTDESGMMLLIDAVRMAAGPKWCPSSVFLKTYEPKILRKYEALSEASFKHCANYAAFLIPRKLLSRPVLRTPEKQALNSVPEKALKASAPPKGLIDTITHSIRVGMQTEVLTAQQVADLAGTSVRSLQRKLEATGTSYRELLDRVRFQEATSLLADPKVPIGAIADFLGYSDPANFGHAFYRWAGISPSTYRNNSLN